MTVSHPCLLYASLISRVKMLYKKNYVENLSLIHNYSIALCREADGRDEQLKCQCSVVVIHANA